MQLSVKTVNNSSHIIEMFQLKTTTKRNMKHHFQSKFNENFKKLTAS